MVSYFFPIPEEKGSSLFSKGFSFLFNENGIIFGYSMYFYLATMRENSLNTHS